MRRRGQVHLGELLRAVAGQALDLVLPLADDAVEAVDRSLTGHERLAVVGRPDA